LVGNQVGSECRDRIHFCCCNWTLTCLCSLFPRYPMKLCNCRSRYGVMTLYSQLPQFWYFEM
jgi:hypothetical protein